jgi:hypothetical protein
VFKPRLTQAELPTIGTTTCTALTPPLMAADQHPKAIKNALATPASS